MKYEKNLWFVYWLRHPLNVTSKKNKCIEAKVRFCKNNTDGTHTVYGDTLDEIVTQIMATLEELK